MTDLGGDLTICDGDYCPNCREANALDCMAVGVCERRDLARAIMALHNMPSFPENDLNGCLGDDGEGGIECLREFLAHTYLNKQADDLLRRAAIAVLSSLNPRRNP